MMFFRLAFARRITVRYIIHRVWHYTYKTFTGKRPTISTKGMIAQDIIRIAVVLIVPWAITSHLLAWESFALCIAGRQ